MGLNARVLEMPPMRHDVEPALPIFGNALSLGVQEAERRPRDA